MFYIIQMHDTRARAMNFSYPDYLESDPKYGFTEARKRMTSVGALDTKVKSLGGKQLKSQDCKDVLPLFTAAKSELDMLEWRIRESRNRYNKSSRARPREAWSTYGCTLFLGEVYVAFVEPYLTAKRYIYIPFQYPKELPQWATEWQEYYSEKKLGVGEERKSYEVIVYSSTKRQLQGIPLLSQIYIFGHSSAGSQSLTAEASTTNPNDKVQWGQLARQMEVSGLSKEFWGKIKVWACQGGAASGTNPAFTQRFADRMRGLGYNNCEYFGYTSNLAAPSTFAFLGGRYTSDVNVKDESDDNLIKLAKGSVTIMEQLQRQFSPEFKASFALFDREVQLKFLRNELMRLAKIEKEMKPSDVRVDF
jgi:hypothetical protein